MLPDHFISLSEKEQKALPLPSFINDPLAFFFLYFPHHSVPAVERNTLRALANEQRVALMRASGSGKTQFAAAVALWGACVGHRVTLIAPKDIHTRHILQSLHELHARHAAELGGAWSTNADHLTFATGGAIAAAPPTLSGINGRHGLLIVDEANAMEPILLHHLLSTTPIHQPMLWIGSLDYHTVNPYMKMFGITRGDHRPNWVAIEG